MDNQTVQSIITQYVHKYGSKLKKLWLCPQIVRNPRVGGEYTLEVASNTKLSTQLLEAEVTKHWCEGDCLCIAYKASDEMLAQGVDKLLERNNTTIEEVIE